ncbi:Inner membrane protein yghQ [Citrobacter amalonaticus]|nr:Inner membrane protein yghQ [Citrobacter amalonaticus]
MKKWFADGAFRTIIRNSAYLGSSNVVSALLGLLALSCAGKGMTPAMFGVLVIVQSYTKAISDFAKFQTWQLVVQYGTPALENNNQQQFRDVISFSFSLDIASGAAAILCGMGLLPFLFAFIRPQCRQLLAGNAVLHADPINGLINPDGDFAGGKPF